MTLFFSFLLHSEVIGPYTIIMWTKRLDVDTGSMICSMTMAILEYSTKTQFCCWKYIPILEAVLVKRFNAIMTLNTVVAGNVYNTQFTVTDNLYKNKIQPMILWGGNTTGVFPMLHAPLWYVFTQM